MGIFQSTQYQEPQLIILTEEDVHDPQHHHPVILPREPATSLMQRISEDIASGNEGDILDMQCRLACDANSPHLWQHHHHFQESQETQISSPGASLTKEDLRYVRNVHGNETTGYIVDEMIFKESERQQQEEKEPLSGVELMKLVE